MAGDFDGPSTDWDPMKADYSSFNDSQNSNDKLDHTRLYVKNIPPGLNEAGLRSAFSKYGKLESLFLSFDPCKKYCLVKYETPGEARLAMTKLNNTEPLKLIIQTAFKEKPNQKSSKSQVKKSQDHVSQRSLTSNELSERRERERTEELREQRQRTMYNEDDGSLSSRGNRNGMSAGDDMFGNDLSDLGGELDPDLELEMERLRLQEVQIIYKQKLRAVEMAEKRISVSSGRTSRSILPDGRIVVQNTTHDRTFEGSKSTEEQDSCGETSQTCSCRKDSLQRSPDDGTSTATTCVLCSEDTTRPDKSSRLRCELKFSDLTVPDDQVDETDRLVKLRNVDYLDIVDEELKVVIALAGYPKSKMRLRQMEVFQRCLSEVMDLQLKAGLLMKTPVFFDYYLSRGAIVCICKDSDTRDWIIRISPGLQEKMNENLLFFKAKVKRLCLAMLRIPNSSWPATAHDVFKLLQYFNPSIKTEAWKIYSQKVDGNVEVTSFVIDRISGEIIRGPSFKNVVDYNQIEFELTGYIEIYYESLQSQSIDNLTSLGSRVKLLQEIRSQQSSTENSKVDLNDNVIDSVTNDSSKHDKETMTDSMDEGKLDEVKEVASSDGQINSYEEKQDVSKMQEIYKDKSQGVKQLLEESLNHDILKKLKDVKHVDDKSEVIVWSDCDKQIKDTTQEVVDGETEYDNDKPSISAVAMSDLTDSICGSIDNFMDPNINIDSNRGIAYHRRTNYLHVESELKLAITLEGYPQNKLEGSHIRRLKHLFKEYLHKDMKLQRFANLIVPKFQDVYLSNGAVIYICDSLETKDYLMEVLPKFVQSTGLKLVFRDVKNLVRYTRVVMRLPESLAHVESREVLGKLQVEYPNLKPECWKYYSDVAGKQKRQFGVEPASLDVIKSPNFDPIYENQKLCFRIIDRQKRDVSINDAEPVDVEFQMREERSKELLEKVSKIMYNHIDMAIIKKPLATIRANHYSDLIADDLKLYVGPANYPDTRVDDVLFHSIKKSLEIVLCDSIARSEITEAEAPKFHDMYLFDGVIFIISQNMESRHWIEKALPSVNEHLHLNLKSTEFRGAVGIVSMFAKTGLEADEVIKTLQTYNPRLRTKFWRKISTVQTQTKLDVVLQIDKLSAQVISEPTFDCALYDGAVEFNLGHLKSLLKPKSSLEELTRLHANSSDKAARKKKSKLENMKVTVIGPQISFTELCQQLKTLPGLNPQKWILKFADDSFPDTRISSIFMDMPSVKRLRKLGGTVNIGNERVFFSGIPLVPEVPVLQLVMERKKDGCQTQNGGPKQNGSPKENIEANDSKVVLHVPPQIISEEDDLHIIFDVLQDNNPGLNPELWTIVEKDLNKGSFTLIVDKQSATVIKGKKFDTEIMYGGERVSFKF